MARRMSVQRDQAPPDPATGPSNFPVYKIVSVADLVPYARNARLHPVEQVRQLVADIREFGWTNPLLIDESGDIIAGHGRLLAARELNMAEVPAIELAGLSETQKRALRIADNKIALNASWNFELLSSELSELGLHGFDLSLTGFSALEIDQIAAPDLDLTSQWAGMPEFDHQNKVAYQSITIHFADPQAVQTFAELIGQSLTNKTKSTWFPRIEPRVNADKRYVTQGAS